MAACEAFTIPISPKVKSQGKPSKAKDVLTLAPFNPVPKILFHDIKVGRNATQDLLIRNPSPADAKVTLSKLPLKDHNLTLSAVEFEVKAGQDFVLTITWTPKEAGAWKESFGICSSTKFKADVSILCSAVDLNKDQKKVLTARNAAVKTQKPAQVVKKARTSVVPAPRFQKKDQESVAQERRKTFVLQSRNKENASQASPKKTPKRPEPAPRKSLAAAVVPSRFEDLVISPFVSGHAHTRFRDFELSPAVNGSRLWKEKPTPGPSTLITENNCVGRVESTADKRDTFAVCSNTKRTKVTPTFLEKAMFLDDSLEENKVQLSESELPPETPTMRRETYAVYNGGNLLTQAQNVIIENEFEDSLEAIEPMEETVAEVQKRSPDYNFTRPRNVHDESVPNTSLFDPLMCSTAMKISVKPPDEVNIDHEVTRTFSERSEPMDQEFNNDRFSADTFIVGRLSSETYVEDRLSSESFAKDTGRLSSETYVEDRLSSESFAKDTGRLSSETYVKDRLSSESVGRDTHPASNEHDGMFAIDSEGKRGSNARRRLSPSRWFLNNDALTETAPLESISEENMPVSAEASNPETSCQAVTLSFSPPKPRLRIAPAISPPKSVRKMFKAPKSPQKKLAKRVLGNKTSTVGRLSPKRVEKRTSLISSGKKLVRLPDTLRKSLPAVKEPAMKVPPTAMSRLSLSRCPPRVSTNLTSAATARRSRKSEFLFDPDAILAEMVNTDLIAASTSADPFLSNTLYYDDEWKLRQEKDMIKWLNALLTPPIELATNADSCQMDIADIYQRCCRQQEIELAPSREDFSANVYHAPARLLYLRKAAMAFLRKPEICRVLGKVAVHVEKKLLLVREDRDLHVDLGLKYQVLELLLCYNPLWLRIGLEAVYGRTVPLNSNADIVGLVRFIMENLLTDKHTVAVHSHPSVPHLMQPSFRDAMKKFILKKFLFLVYLLDRAKANKLIGHDPCLFMKKAQYKESREILTVFASSFLSGVGDITKHLSLLGYKVSVKQQYLDEFEYAVSSLKDLRDGVRLVRVMEIILKNDSLLPKLRVPAISMLQKIHNMDIALNALSDAGYVILGNITAKDLVNGHHEKTLSLLWQVIYKFQAPRLEQAAVTIQKWWRKSALDREIQRRIKRRKMARRDAAACRIQAAWRGTLARKRVALLREERAAELVAREKAAVVIQKFWRMYAAKLHLKRVRAAANRIKAWYFGAVITKELRAKFLRKREAAIKIQSVFRGYLTRKRLTNLRRTAAALRIQTWFRRLRTAKLLQIAVSIAKDWIEERERQREACRTIQTRFRSYLAMKKERRAFLSLRESAKTVQRLFRQNLEMKKEREAFLTLRHAAIVCQQVFRAGQAMKKQRTDYLALRQATITIQSRYRAILLMRRDRSQFLLMRTAATKIQTWFRACREMKKQRREFVRMKNAVCVIQNHLRATLAMREQRNLYISMRSSAILVQRYYRSFRRKNQERAAFLLKKSSAIVVQRSYRAFKHRQKVVSSAVTLQRKWRATKLMRIERATFISLRTAAVSIQNRWRAQLEMRERRSEYLDLRQSAVVLQRQWRAIVIGRNTRREFLRLRSATVVLQRAWRAAVLMKTDRSAYLQLQAAATTIQKRWRCILQHREAERLEKAVTFVKRKWLANRLMRKQRLEYLILLQTTIFIQRRYREKLRHRTGFLAHQKREQAATKIQAAWRGFITRKKQSEHLALMKERCRMAKDSACHENTLAFRTSRALAMLRSGSMAKASEALNALDKITLLSPSLCRLMVADDVISFIYNFLGVLNRSEAHREVMLHGTNVLLNLSKFTETIRGVWQDGCLWFYLHLMNVWVNKDEDVFLNCATILWHFLQCADLAEKMAVEPKMERFLQGLLRRTAKKPKLAALRSFPPQTMPSPSPTWGLVWKKPRKFCDQRFAVQVIARSLFQVADSWEEV